jgi:muconate cycloisomerase
MRAQDAVTARLMKPIEIKSVEAIPVGLPLKKPIKMARVEISVSDTMIVRIEAKDGTVGWGEAAAAPTMSGDTLPAMRAAIEHMTPILVGKDARDRAALVRELAISMYGNTGAKSALEMALADLVGRTLNVPFSDLYGGALRRQVKPMWLVGNATPELDIEDVKARMKEGFRFFKLKVGTKSVDKEIAIANAVREVAGPDVMLCADANTGYDFASADKYLRGVADKVNLSFLEQPLRPDDMAGLTRLCQRHTISMGADEGIHGLGDIEEHAAAGIGGLSLKLIKFGGLTALLKAADLCERMSLDMNLAGKMSESGLGGAAIAHIGCMLPSANWGISLTHMYLADDIVKDPLKIVDGWVTPPGGPGLGVDVDEAAVKRLRVKA